MFGDLSLRRPAAIVIQSRHARVDAMDRIRRAVSDRVSVEGNPEIEPARRLRGDLKGFDVRLHLRVEDVEYRSNRTWSVEFRGTVEVAGEGSLLRGLMTVGHPSVIWFLALWRWILALVAIAGVATALSGTTSGWLISVAAVGLIVGSVALDRYGTRHARGDAVALANVLREILR